MGNRQMVNLLSRGRHHRQRYLRYHSRQPFDRKHDPGTPKGGVLEGKWDPLFQGKPKVGEI